MQHFRFLDLPKELRLMVYEFLPRRVLRSTYVTYLYIDSHETSFTLISTFPPKAILATCKLAKEEAGTILHPSDDEEGNINAQSTNPEPRIETDLESLWFILEGGLIDTIARWFHLLDQGQTEGKLAEFDAQPYELHEFFKFYRFRDGTPEEGLLRARYFVWRAGWSLYRLSRHWSLDKYQTHRGCITPRSLVPFPDFISRLGGPIIQIAVTQRPADKLDEYYDILSAFYGYLNETESIAGIRFFLHLLSADGFPEETSMKKWTEMGSARSEIFDGASGFNGCLQEGIYESDRVWNAIYNRYWCNIEWPENCSGSTATCVEIE